jgi:hypothetical protein
MEVTLSIGWLFTHIWIVKVRVFCMVLFYLVEDRLF